METTLELLAFVAIALASGWGGHLAARRWPVSRKVLLTAGAAIVAWPIAADLWPDRLQFLHPSFPRGELLFALAFLWVGVIAAMFGHSSRHRVLTTVFGVVLAYFVFAAPIHLALDGNRIRALNLRVDQGVTVQEAPYTCVPSSLATVLRRWGHEFTEGELAYALRTSFQGTSPARVPPFVSRLPVHPPLEGRVIDTSYEELAQFDVPAILIGKSGPIRHAVALLELDGDQVTIGDPLRGLVTMPRAKVNAVFAWSGQAILILPRETAPDSRPRLVRR
jgi:hypothetical protein